MYEIFYPSGTIKKDGVTLVFGTPEYDTYLAWQGEGNGPEVREDPPPPPQIVIGIGKVLAALAQLNPTAHQAVLDGLQLASDDYNLSYVCDGAGMSEQQRYAVFELAQTL